MYYEELKEAFKRNADLEQARFMSAYLKDQFSFYGIKQPQRKALQREFWKKEGLPAINELPQIVVQLFHEEQREYVYFATELIEKMIKNMNVKHLSLIEELAQIKPWWDSIDNLSTRIVGRLLENKRLVAREWAFRWLASSNIWMKRIAILFQLKYKQQTDLELLEIIIEKTANSNEFFIKKAIGWILREYSKTDAEWVIDFLDDNQLKPLSRTEAMRWIKKHRD